jgi:hypothetical protein
MEAEKQERAIQRQLHQVANKEEKEAEKTRKALEREKKRAQKGARKTQGARCRCPNSYSVKSADPTSLCRAPDNAQHAQNFNNQGCQTTKGVSKKGPTLL